MRLKTPKVSSPDGGRVPARKITHAAPSAVTVAHPMEGEGSTQMAPRDAMMIPRGKYLDERVGDPPKDEAGAFRPVPGLRRLDQLP